MLPQSTVRSHETVFMFSGQGSQYFQMGRQLFEDNDTFRRCMRELDEIPREITGHSVVNALYTSGRGRRDVFDSITLTHPAIFMVQYAVARSLMQQGVYPDIVLGASLGSFAAVAVAGFLSATDALRAVVEQARAFHAYCRPGGMLAILEDTALSEEAFIREQSTLASINFDSHFTVSATEDSLARIEAVLKYRHLNFQRLPVRFAFHSCGIDGAKEAFMAYLNTMSLREGTLPLLCCSQPQLLRTLPKQYLWDVVRHPVRFREAVALLERRGAHRYIDAGPSGTLATFLKYGFAGKTLSTVHSTLTPFGLDTKNMAALTAVGATN